MYKGIIINIEGTDGSGKTTQVDRLIKRLESDGYEVFHHKFPTENCVCSAPVYAYLNQEIDTEGITGMDAAILYLADMVCWRKFISDAVDEGKVVILDRYYNSNLMHQVARDWEENYPGAFNEHPLFKMFAYQFAVHLKGIVRQTSLPTPDKVIYLYASPELTAQRREVRNNGGDLHENNNVHQILACQFGMVAAEHEGWSVVDEGTEESPLSIEEIHEKVYALVKETIDKFSEDE